MTRRKMKIIYQQRTYLKKLATIAARPFYVADAQPSGEPSVRHIYHDMLMDQRLKTMPYRTVLVNELAFDMDTENYPFLKLITEEAIDWLDANHVPKYLFGSAGKGTHISVFCDFGVYGDVFGYDSVRVALWDWVVSRIGFYGYFASPNPDIMVGSGKPICKSCAVFSDASQGHIIRLCGAEKIWRGSSQRKTLIENMPDSREEMYREQPVFPDKIRLWKVPESILSSLIITYNLKHRTCGDCIVASDNRQWETVEYPSQYPDVCMGCGAIYDYIPLKDRRTEYEERITA